MIEKKILIFGLFVLFLLPASALAADGDSSPESTIVFSETLPDDIMFYPDNETHGTGYAKSFLDVSDWTMWSPATISSDGDVATIEIPNEDDWNHGYTNAISLSVGPGWYYEIRYKSNVTFDIMYVYFQSGAGGTGDRIGQIENLNPTTTWKTHKGHIADTGTIESIKLTGLDNTDATFEIDFLRISNSTSMGWQHDGSTTAGVAGRGDANKTYTESSDGDILTFNITTDADAVGSTYYYIYFDTTTTKIDLERDYYSFVEMRARLIENTGAGAGLLFGADGYYSYIDSSFVETSWTTYRINLNAATSASSTKACYLYWGGGASSTIEFQIDYVKAYSIANHTVTQSGVTTDDVLYVDSGVLYSQIDDGYIELNHDPTLSVVPDTYPLYYNLSTIGTAPEFAMYVSSWSTYSDETRGIISSRIVTDIKLKFDSTEIISEIKFAMDDISIFSELFLSLDMWGYLGPMAMIVIGYVLAKKEKFLGVLWFAVECLFVSQYLTLVEAMPDYWWHIFILLVGGLFTCVYPLLDR